MTGSKLKDGSGASSKRKTRLHYWSDLTIIRVAVTLCDDQERSAV